MPQPGQAIPIDDAWREEVEARLRAKGWSRAELARQAKCAPSAITQLLNGAHDQSPLVPKIERVLGMSTRFRKNLSDLERKIAEVVNDLDETERARLYERALAIREERRR